MILVAILALACVIQLVMAISVYIAVRGVTWLSNIDPPRPAEWPRLSIIVPACNEGATIEAALATLCQQTYPNLEIVVVDDRSTDATGEIIGKMAKNDPRILPVRVDTLPPQWLGKVHALHVGAQKSHGELLLFTDADIHFGKDSLERSVAYAVERRLDHLSILPSIVAPGLFLQAAISAFGGGYLFSTKAHEINDEGSTAFAGVGAFNMVRRSKLEETPGLEWLRMEVGDDIGLGFLMHLYGARKGFLLGNGMLSVMWYPSLGEMIRGLEKNSFGIFCAWRYERVIATIIGLTIVTISPVVAAFHPYFPLRTLGLITLATMLGTHLVAGKAAGVSIAARLLSPFANLVIVWALIRSAFLCWRQGGAKWRGTLYAIEDLRRFLRVKVGPNLRPIVPKDMPPPRSSP